MKKYIYITIFVFLLGGLYFHARASRNQNAMDFETNSTQYLSLTDTAALSPGPDDWTISMLIKYESNNVFRYLFENVGSVSNNHVYLALTTTGFIAAKMADAQDDKVEETGVIPVKPGKWYHVSLSKRGTVVYSCVDGNTNFSTGNSLIGAITLTAGTALNIAAATGASTFDGMIDEVRIYKSAIPCEAQKGTMRRELGTSTDTSINLQGYWKFNDDLSDSSGKGNTATNNNSAVFTTEIPFGHEMFMFQ